MMASIKTAKKALEEISKANDDRLTAKLVVEHAKASDHPLHDYFDWDDSEAAEKWRLEQARKLIRSIRISVVVEESTIQTIRYIRDPDSDPDQQGYITINRLVDDVERSREALLYEFGRIQSSLERAREIAAVLNLTDELDALLETIGQLRGRVDAQREITENVSV